MSSPASPILAVKPLGFPWETADPFLFCAYHDDAYPKGNGKLGPAVSLAGRDIGQDFSRKDGWSMYHGDSVPGFPAHPHRGFETVTIVRKGLIDHSDSLGATARFGDVAPLAPPPDSWAAQAESDVAIWTLRLEPGAGFQLPPATLAGTQRTLYFFKGDAASVGGQPVPARTAITLEADVEVAIV